MIIKDKIIKWLHSIKAKIVMLQVVVLILVLATGTYSMVQGNIQREQQLYDTLDKVAQANSELLNTIIEANISTLKNIAMAPALLDEDMNQGIVFLQEILADKEGHILGSMALVALDGQGIEALDGR
ncbi:MAG: hypothetical protein LRZ99_03235, partial [Desulfotomaculum sp.]|nr:hypothetical protein [Desulfotomaculum sp.]